MKNLLISIICFVSLMHYSYSQTTEIKDIDYEVYNIIETYSKANPTIFLSDKNEVLAYMKKTYGEKSYDYIITLIAYAQTYESLEEFQLADEYMTKGAQLLHEGFPKDYNNLFYVYSELGRIKSIEFDFINSIKNYEISLNYIYNLDSTSYNQNYTYYFALSNLSKVYFKLNEFSKSLTFVLKYYKWAITQNDEYAQIKRAYALMDIGDCYFNLGDYPNALLNYEQHKDQIKSIYGELSSEYLQSLMILAHNYGEIKSTLKEDLLNEYLSIAEKYNQPKDDIFIILQMKVLNDFNNQRYNEAYVSVNKMFEIYIEDSSYTINDTSFFLAGEYLSKILEETGNMDEAIKNTEGFIDIYKDDRKKKDYSSAILLGMLNNLALRYSKTGKFDESIEIRKNMMRYRDIDVESKFLYASNLGSAFLNKGDNEKAGKILIKTNKQILNHYNSKINEPYIQNLGLIAQFYERNLNIKEAESCYIEIVELSKLYYGDNSNEYIGWITELALFYRGNNQISEGIPFYIESIKSRTKYIVENLQNFNTHDKELLKIKSITNFNMFLDFSLNHLNNNRKLVNAVYESWLNINGLITSNDQSLKFQINQSNDTNLINVFNEYSLKSMAYMKMIESGNNFPNEEIDELKMNIVELEKKIFLEISKTNLIPRYYSVMDVLSVVKDDEAFVDIIPFYSISNNNLRKPVFTNKYIAFIMTSQTIECPKFVIIENGNDLEDIQLKEYAKSNNVVEGIENKDIDKTSYNAFWAPIANQIRDKKKVFVSMGGVYNNINILTLYNPEISSYLLDEKDIQIVNSGRSFVQSRTKPIPTYINNSAILIGFPNYNDSLTATASSNMIGYSRDLNSNILDSLTRGGFSLSNLPGTKTEVEAIGKSLTRNKWTVDVLTANQASETTLKNSHSPRVLHIATHGYFMNNQELKNEVNALFMGMEKENVVKNPLLRSGLFLAGANQTLKGKVANNGDNGILTAYEASFLDLRETELVVLSACETGRGEVKNGEGIYGLRKAFADAGAKNIIMSLWKVDDKVTQEFMTRFYEIWLNDKSTIREAFNKTQLEIKAKYPQPYYWGAFILVGE